MGEKISDLLRLKDTLEIVTNDPYQDVYDDLSKKLALTKSVRKHSIELPQSS